MPTTSTITLGRMQCDMNCTTSHVLKMSKWVMKTMTGTSDELMHAVEYQCHKSLRDAYSNAIDRSGLPTYDPQTAALRSCAPLRYMES